MNATLPRRNRLTAVRPALVALAFFTLLTGGLYPLMVTLLGQAAFPAQAAGSLLHDAHGRILGSRLIAQKFTGEEWFQSRPSAGDFATLPSAASNLAPSNPQLARRIGLAVADWGSGPRPPVPLALVTTSASGLDPDLPVAAVRYQLPRVAAARRLPEATLQAQVDKLIQHSPIGPAVVNILRLNQTLAGLAPSTEKHADR